MTFRSENDAQIPLHAVAPNFQPSIRSLQIIAGLAKANALIRVPLMRVKERAAGAPTRDKVWIKGDCLRSVIRELLADTAVLGKFHFLKGHYL